MKLNNKTSNSIQAYISYLVASLFFFYTIMQLSIFNITSSYLLYTFKLTSLSLGTVSSLYLYALAITLLPAGFILDRYSTRNISLIIMGLSVISALFIAVTHSLSLLCIYRIMTGIANGFAFLTALRIASHCFPRNKAIAMSIIVSITICNAIIAYSIPSITVLCLID